MVVKDELHNRGVAGSIHSVGTSYAVFSFQLVPVAGGGAGSNLPVGTYWPFLPVSHSSLFLRDRLRNSSPVTLCYTSCFICVVRHLFRKRRHTFRTVYAEKRQYKNLARKRNFKRKRTGSKRVSNFRSIEWNLNIIVHPNLVRLSL
jgi:hypothetical protein